MHVPCGHGGHASVLATHDEQACNSKHTLQAMQRTEAKLKHPALSCTTEQP